MLFITKKRRLRMKQIQNKETLLAMGYTIIYAFRVIEKDKKYHFIGLISQETKTVIPCTHEVDMNYRKDCLLEGQYYASGDDNKDEELLMQMAYERVKAKAHVHPCPIEDLEHA
jgi:hypothetical protein